MCYYIYITAEGVLSMKLGIKIISASLALALTLCSLCSCGTSTSSEGSSSSSAKPNETQPSITTTNANETEAALKSDEESGSEYVYTAKEYYCPFTGSFGITGEKDIKGDKIRNRVPLLKLNSEDAAAVNDEIKTDFSKELGSEIKDGTDTHCRTDYISNVNGKILSLVIENRTTDTPQSNFWIYNLNVDSGARTEKSDLFEQTDITENEALEKIRADIEDRFSKLPDDYSSMDYISEAKENSLSDENLELTEYYLDESGNLIACYILYWVAGAEMYCTLLNISE